MAEPVEFDGLTFDGYNPGAIGRLVSLHMDYYGPAWNFGLAFETSVAGELASFFQQFKAERDLFIGAYDRSAILQGAIALNAIDADLARLRWFVVGAEHRGRGLGREFMRRAVGFAQGAGIGRLYLTTFSGLEASRHLYEDFGFTLTGESDTDRWQGGVVEQRFELNLWP